MIKEQSDLNVIKGTLLLFSTPMCFSAFKAPLPETNRQETPYFSYEVISKAKETISLVYISAEFIEHQAKFFKSIFTL